MFIVEIEFPDPQPVGHGELCQAIGNLMIEKFKPARVRVGWKEVDEA